MLVLVLLAFLRVVFGQRPEDRAAQRAQHAVAAGLVPSKSTRGSAGHRAQQAALPCGAICVDGCAGLVVI